MQWRLLDREKVKITIGCCLAVFFLAACVNAQNGSANTGSRNAVRAGTLLGNVSPVSIEDTALTHGQLIYVPAYSEIFNIDEASTHDLTIMLSIRNTDLTSPIVIRSVQYYNSAGDLVREYVETPLALPPMATAEIVVSRLDRTGGTGANFLVEWGAEASVYEPVIEALMSSTSQQQGLSFLSAGRVLESRP